MLLVRQHVIECSILCGVEFGETQNLLGMLMQYTNY